MPRTGSPPATSTRARAARTAPPTTRRSGASWRSEDRLLQRGGAGVRGELDAVGAAILKADRRVAGIEIAAHHGRGKRDALARPGHPHLAADSDADRFADAVEQRTAHRPVDRKETLVADHHLERWPGIAAIAPQVDVDTVLSRKVHGAIVGKPGKISR